MVLGLLKWLKETCFYKEKKKTFLQRHELCIQRRKLVERRSLHDILGKESYNLVLKKYSNDRIFSLAWNIVSWLLKSHCFEFFRGGAYGLFWAKKLIEIYLLITEKFLCWTFWEWEIRSVTVFSTEILYLIFTDYWNVLVLNFSGMENTVFFEAKSWWKDDIYRLLKSSCFELSPDGKRGLFCGKNLRERWYLLITEKLLFWATETFLFWAFRWWEIRSSLAKKLM